MGKDTAISWCDATFNPWIGCTKVSPGCKHCYAAALTNARPALILGPGVPRTDESGRLPLWGDTAPRRVTSAENWKQPLRWNRAAEKAGVRRRVFCASLADVFEDWGGQPSGQHPWPSLDTARATLWSLIEATPALDWLLLTKRPENVLRMVPMTWAAKVPGSDQIGGRFPANVWIGTTAEDQQRADERIPHLLQIPAAVRFVSEEPALEVVNLMPWMPRYERQPGVRDGLVRAPGIDWLIVGGESGAGARPFDLAWARSAVAQCKAAGVPCFVKQMGARPFDSNVNCSDYRTDYADDEIFTTPPPGVTGAAAAGLRLRDRAGADPAEWPEDLKVREWPEVRRP